MDESKENRAVNDATLTKAGDIYQYLIALKDCFELNDGEKLQIEVNGDVSILNEAGGKFQKEVKHHFGEKNLTDRDIDFWKTLANWYVEFDRIKDFSCLILCTTAVIPTSSPFSGWNEIDAEKKLERIQAIGVESKKNEKTFREQYSRIFNDTFNKERILIVLGKFSIMPAQTTITGIASKFSKYVGHIPEENRDSYIGALLGQILIKVKDPPHKWEVTRSEFERILQVQSATHGIKGSVPLPNEYEKAELPEDQVPALDKKRFIEAIREIEFQAKIPDAMSDYWRADMTVAKYFRDDLLYLESLDSYREDLSKKIGYAKDACSVEAEGKTEQETIRISKRFYADVMAWDPRDFGSIVRNRGFFQRGVIHNIVDESEFTWKVDEEVEH